MFHVEHFFLSFLCAAAAIQPLSAKDFLSKDTLPEQTFPLGGDISEEACRLTALGWECLLIGDNETAPLLFHQAADSGSTSPLTDLGLLMTAQDDAQREKARARLTEHMEQESMLPREAFFVRAMLALVNQDTETAAKEFAGYAKRYRADRTAACWDIVLNHYLTAANVAEHEKVVDRAHNLYSCYPDDVYVCYARALCEEFHTGTSVTEEALQAASSAAAQEHPVFSLLQAHLFRQQGRNREAAPIFRRAREQAPPHSYRERLAALNEACSLWCCGEKRASLRLRRELNAIPFTSEQLTEPVDLLQRWEINTLPLRLLLCTPDAFDQGDVRAAAVAATPQSKKLLHDEAALQYRDALVLMACARREFRQGNKGEASRLLTAAAGKVDSLSSYHVSPELRFYHRRAKEACNVALNNIRAEVFQTTSGIWKEHADESVRPNVHFLPPLYLHQTL